VGQLVVDHASHPAHAARLLHAGAATPRSMTYTTPHAAATRFDRRGHDVRIPPGSSACTAPKTPVAWRAPVPRVQLARPPAQHAGRRPPSSSALATMFLMPSHSLISDR
jgi:hypothetical protein